MSKSPTALRRPAARIADKAPEPDDREKDVAPPQQTGDADAARRPWWKSRRILRPVLMGGGLALVLLVGGFMWLGGGRFVSTDDAYVRAAKLLVSTDVPGIVSTIEVKEGQSVKQGQVLFRLDPRQYEIAVAGAKAQLSQTALSIEAMKQDYQRMLRDIEAQQAQVDQAEAQYRRYAALVKGGSISQSTYDDARFKYEAARQTLASERQQAQTQVARLNGNPDIAVTDHPQYQQAKAQVDEAQRQLDHSIVRAPFDGIVSKVDTLQPGMYLAPNAAAMALVSTDQLWIEANMKETDLTWVKPGDRVSVSVDTYPGRVWVGTVDTVSPASGAEFSVLPAQNASGNWVKVVQRIPLRIVVDRKAGDPALRAGMSVIVDVDTGHRRTLSDIL
ncbi:HlyD family secretion protein [Vineibacter terrae]|uniref:HlyD family secretion protein n=1 Tax=Vineibacter terrae TaxID=2586908 RepID=UPI002E38025E|nr:HlyD family secretion protein [Vineibacter terrae]HEX2886866.1 HlyD family secretion protein [Vineibacter terrae]